MDIFCVHSQGGMQRGGGTAEKPKKTASRTKADTTPTKNSPMEAARKVKERPVGKKLGVGSTKSLSGHPRPVKTRKRGPRKSRAPVLPRAVIGFPACTATRP
jgi:hypothetical protein